MNVTNALLFLLFLFFLICVGELEDGCLFKNFGSKLGEDVG